MNPHTTRRRFPNNTKVVARFKFIDMKYDNIIIGGGLSGLVCGIESARSGRKTAIVSAGQSALHSGLALLNFFAMRIPG